MTAKSGILLLPLVLLIALAPPARAQRLLISRIDSSDYPIIHAKVYVIDRSGSPMTGLSEKDFAVQEGGAARDITSLRCPSPGSSQALSSVLTIDISSSMAYGSSSSRAPNIALAKAAAAAWVDGLPAGESECALSTFDDGSMVNLDFTIDRSRLRAAIDGLRPQGGTDYNAGLIALPAGSLSIAAGGRNRRVVIFLTDGQGRGDESAIVDAAAKIDATIFCVTLGMPAPAILKRIAARTGGECFENVTTVEEAADIYRAILYRAQGGEPCELSWRSESGCSTDRKVLIEIPARALQASAGYAAPRNSVGSITLTPQATAFGVVRPGSTKEQQVYLAATGRPVTITAIQPASRSSAFTLADIPIPFTIRAGERKSITIRYAPTDTNFTFMRWSIASDACSGAVIYASGGAGGRAQSTLHLLAPNGGESFRPGEEATIRWEGLLPTDTVRLEYSTDEGGSWRSITSRALGLSYRWSVPPTPSTRCLARVGLVGGVGGDGKKNGLELAGHTDWVITTAFSPDGGKLASASWDGRAKIWDARTGTLIRTLVISPKPADGGWSSRVFYTEFSHDGSRLLTATDNYTAQIWDVASGRLLQKFSGSPFNKADATHTVGTEGETTPDPIMTPDGTRILLLTAKIPTVWDAISGRKRFELTGHTGWVNSAAFSPDGKWIVSASRDSTVRIYDGNSGGTVRRFGPFSYPVSSAMFSTDSRYITAIVRDTIHVFDAVTGAELSAIHQKKFGGTSLRALFSPDGTNLLVWAGSEMPLTLYDFRSGRETRRLEELDEHGRSTGQSAIGYATFSPDGSRVAAMSGDVQIWDATTGTLVERFPWDGQMSHSIFSPDGERIASGLNQRAAIWNIDAAPSQRDQSDSLWSILDARAASSDVDFGRRLVGTRTDSVITRYIRNDGTVPLKVDAITIAGANPRDFSLVSGIPPFDVAAGDARSVEFRFSPASAGMRSATADIVAGGRTLHQNLSGEGVQARLRLESESVDFDTVMVGTSRDTTIRVMLRNNGSAPLEITRAAFIGPDTTQFSMADGMGPFTIPAGGSKGITVRFAPTVRGRTSTRLAFFHDGPGGSVATELYGHGVTDGDDIPGVAYSDPTTFRTVLAPNAIIPKKGSLLLGTYDLLGLMAGYAISDNIMLLAGGAPPLPDDWGGTKGTAFGAYSLGFKFGAPLTKRLNVAIGVQAGRSMYDDQSTDPVESRISFGAGYLSASYGTDDARVSATGGYALKHHNAIGVGEFDRNAIVGTLGGDYRFARRWKAEMEVITMQTLGYVPIIVGARFFGNGYALDFGVGYLGITTDGGAAPSLPIAPLVSYLLVL